MNFCFRRCSSNLLDFSMGSSEPVSAWKFKEMTENETRQGQTNSECLLASRPILITLGVRFPQVFHL